MTTSVRAACAALLAACACAPATAHADKPAEVQLLGFNDLHGALAPAEGGTLTVDGVRTPAGGAGHLAAWLERLRAEGPKRSLTVSAGDLIGASPLSSALFHDEPTIAALEAMDLAAAAVGNHELDEGYAELQRIQDGGCHPVDGCQFREGYDGADFPYLAANVVREDGSRAFPATTVRKVKGIEVGLVGAVLQGTPEIVDPSGIQGLRFEAEAPAINAAIREAERKGKPDVWVVLLHQGGLAGGRYDDCAGFAEGDLEPILQGLTSKASILFTGHTHQAYDCRLGGRTVVSGASTGRVVSEVTARVDRKRGLVGVTSENHLVTQDVAQDPEVKAIADEAAAEAAPLAQRVVGTAAADLTRAATPAGESVLGDVIADAQLAAGQAAGAQLALMNPGGIRADVAAGEVTYGEAFTVQPFGNILQVVTLTGAELDAVLEQQFDNPSAGQNRILQVSQGFAYTWDAAAPKGAKVSGLTLGGVPVDPAASYRVAVNNFLVGGGDGFSAFAGAEQITGVGQDLDAFTAYLGAAPVGATPRDRITRVG